MSSRKVAKAWVVAAVVLMVASGIGLIATLIVDAFVLDRYNAYGEVPVPGSGKIHLPAGQVTISFHTVTVGNSSGGGLPLPHLMLDIDPPAGLASPALTEDIGGSTSVNNDIHRRVWVAAVATEGDYIITTSGETNGFISPRMAFGRDSDSGGSWLAVFGGLLVLGLAATIVGSIRLSRVKRDHVWRLSVPPVEQPVVVPSAEGVKIEQLKTLAALRDSGALTEQEFQDEKRRVLRGG